MPLFKVHCFITLTGDTDVVVEAADAASAERIVEQGDASVDWDQWLDLANQEFEVADDDTREVPDEEEDPS